MLRLASLVVVIVYLYQGVTPAFNGDDIVQMQYPDGNRSILFDGRWAYYLVYAVLFDYNMAPVFSTVLGSLLIVASGAVAADILEFRLAVSKLAFIVVSSVSIYYGDLFVFHSTRMAFPLGNLIAVLGLRCVLRRHWVAGVALMALAPAFYQATDELAATVLVAFALRRTGDSDRARRGPIAALPAAACLCASLVIYALFTRALCWALGIWMDPDRTSLDLLAVLHRFPDVVQLFTLHSVPVLAARGDWYLPASIAPFVTALGAGFVIYSTVAAYRRGGAAGAVVAAVLNVALVVAPYCLIFASGGGNTSFAPRALYAFATVHAVWGGALLEWSAPFARRPPPARFAAIATLALVGVIAFENAAVINEVAFDTYLASQSDLLATNRIISRIETLLGETPNAPTEDIPIAVIYDRWTLAGPRGNIGTTRSNSWSREWIFRLIDRRFRWIKPDAYQPYWQAARSHGEWPAKDSVFLKDGVVVVVITK